MGMQNSQEWENFFISKDEELQRVQTLYTGLDKQTISA